MDIQKRRPLHAQRACLSLRYRIDVVTMTSHPMKKMEHGYPLLQAPAINKGDAFTQIERDARGLQGLLPTAVKTMQQQVQRGKSAELLKEVCGHICAYCVSKFASEGIAGFVRESPAQVPNAHGIAGCQRNRLLQVFC